MGHYVSDDPPCCKICNCRRNILCEVTHPESEEALEKREKNWHKIATTNNRDRPVWPIRVIPTECVRDSDWTKRDDFIFKTQLNTFKTAGEVA